MKIEPVVKNDLAILMVDGEMDISNAANFKTAIKEQLSASMSKLIIDFREVSYIDSSGLGVLVSSFATVLKAGGKLKLSDLSRRVKEIFQLAELIEYFEVYDTLEDAIKSFNVKGK